MIRRKIKGATDFRIAVMEQEELGRKLKAMKVLGIEHKDDLLPAVLEHDAIGTRELYPGIEVAVTQVAEEERTIVEVDRTWQPGKPRVALIRTRIPKNEERDDLVLKTGPRETGSKPWRWMEALGSRLAEMAGLSSYRMYPGLPEFA